MELCGACSDRTPAGRAPHRLASTETAGASSSSFTETGGAPSRTDTGRSTATDPTIPITGLWADADGFRYATCGLHTNGRVECWGIRPDKVPTPPSNVAMIQVRMANSPQTKCPEGGHYGAEEVGCGVTVHGDLTCWGGVQWPQAEIPPGPYMDFDIASGGWGCGLRVDGTLTCFVLCPEYYDHPSPPVGEYRDLSMSADDEACAVSKDDGRVECWAGDPRFESAMADVRGAVRVEINDPRFICVLLGDGTVQCAGRSGDEPFPPTPPGTYKDLAASNGYVCAVHTDGRLECWGYPGHHADVVDAEPAGNYVSVKSEWTHACAISESADLLCWGGGMDYP